MTISALSSWSSLSFAREMESTWSTVLSGSARSSGFLRGLVELTTMVRSAPSFFATSTGIFAVSPPSTRFFPLTFVGENRIGTVEDAFMASVRLPEVMTTWFPSSILVDTAAKLYLRSAKLSGDLYLELNASTFSISVICCPLDTDEGSTGLNPSSEIVSKLLSCTFFCSRKRLRLSFLSDREITSFQFILLNTELSSLEVYPEEYKPPTILPILVPTIRSTSISLSSKTFNTPIWEIPLAPPPLNTRPIFFLLYFIGNILKLRLSR